MSDVRSLNFFERYLTLWVLLCMTIGASIGVYFPVVPETLVKCEYAHISIPTAMLIATMIYPMMLKIDFKSIRRIGDRPQGIILTCTINWLIKPFTMLVIAWLFFFVFFKEFIDPVLAQEYVAGAVLLGAAPCTAMVFVWSYLTNGNSSYTLAQVATNDLIILFAFVPIVSILLGATDIVLPMSTLLLSVTLFVIVPLVAAVLTRKWVVSKRGQEYFDKVFSHHFDSFSMGALLLTLVILFSFQGQSLLENSFHMILIAIPLIIQTFLVFMLAYYWGYRWHLPHEIAAPAAMVGASNFFELAVAVAISLFGLDSGAAMVTVVGVLVEVPLMLALVRLANSTRNYFS